MEPDISSVTTWHYKGSPKFSPTHQRDEVIERKNRLVSALADFAQRADADLAALLQSEMQDLIELYEDFKARSGCEHGRAVSAIVAQDDRAIRRHRLRGHGSQSLKNLGFLVVCRNHQHQTHGFTAFA